MPSDQRVRPNQRADRVAGLDSLRALAVATVLGYHLGAPYFGGGFLGVTLFFVLSGYLITRLLLAEIDARGTADLRRFWVRRLRRLLPAAYVVVVVCLAGSMLFAPDLLPKVRGDGFASLFYASNWWMVFHDVSYFESFGLPSPLAHLWTLAIEEQFYVVWPIVLLVLLALVRKRDRILMVVGGAVVASATLMAVLYDPVDPNRAYMGTDTRMGELLIGAFLALALHLPDGDHVRMPVRVTTVLDSRRAWLALASSTGAFLLLASALPDAAAFAYRGGILLAAVAAAGMILSLQAGAVAKVAVRVDRGPVGALGRRSYSVYLWHYPVIVALSTAQDIGRWDGSRALAVVVATLVLSELSYRLVEGPVRRHGFRPMARALATSIRGLPRPWRRPAFVLAVTPAALALLALAGVNMPAPVDHGPETVVTGPAPVGSDTGRPRSGHGGDLRPVRPDPAAPLVGRDTVAIGDSLMINLAPALGAEVPRITINAEVGRQPWTGLEVATSYGQFNRPGGNYILGIGTNGAIDAESLARFCAEHEEARIFLITPRVARSWESTSVDAITSVARRYDNVRVVDFHRAAGGHPDYFASDGVHLTSAGVRTLVRLILAAALRPA